MPTIIVFGVPSKTSKKMLNQMIADYQNLLAGIKELKIKNTDVSVFIPKDQIEEGLGDEIIIFIRGLYEVPERNANVLSRIVNLIGSQTKNIYFKDSLVECIVEPVSMHRVWCSPPQK